MKQLSAWITKEEETYIAKCPETGTVSQGSTIEEAVENLREATEIYLEEFPIKSKFHALMTTFEITHATA